MQSWSDRLTDMYADFGLISLVILCLAVALGVITNYFYFQRRLEPAIDHDGIPPETVRLEALALALAVGGLIAGFSGWGFVWIALVLAAALIVAVMARSRAIILAVVIVFAIVVLATLLALKA